MFKKCQQCGNEFEAFSNRAEFCPVCRIERKRKYDAEFQRRRAAGEPDPPKVCADCGKQLVSRKAKYCPECGARRRRELNRLYKANRRLKASPVVECAYCGQPFERTSNAQKYCPACRRSRLVKVKCEMCGKEFDARVSRAKYCPDCRVIRKRINQAAYKKRHPESHHSRKFEKRACERCGKPFEAATDSSRRFCSECQHILNVERGVSLGRWQANRPKVCVLCGAKFVGQGNQKYCPACLKADRQVRQQHTRPFYKCTPFKPKSGKTLDDWAREAAQCNLDYGTYRALIAAGRTYEELVAEAPRRSPQNGHSHVHMKTRSN